MPRSSPAFFVVPAYNERENLPRLLHDLEARPDLFAQGGRVIIVDDGSSDGTDALIEGYQGPLVVELVRLGENQGPGAAFRAGFAAALRGCPDEALIVTSTRSRRCSSERKPVRNSCSPLCTAAAGWSTSARCAAS
jgi:glycosyl transferase family 2